MVRDGAIPLGKDLIAGPELTETRLLSAFEGVAEPLIHNGIHRSYVIPAIAVEGRTFTPSLYFTDGVLTFISMTWFDPARLPGADPWKDWSADREKEIARADAAWVRSALNGVGTMTDTYTFPWGTIASGFDERSGFSSVTIRYR
jgi:hypothetical protein